MKYDTVLDLPGCEDVAKKTLPARDRIDLRADPAWVARVEVAAKRFAISVSAYIRQAVTERMERDEATLRERKKAKA